MSIYAELQAICGDFEFLLNSKTFFAQKYDAGSFSQDIVLWMQTDFESAVNCVAKRQLVTIESDDDVTDELLMTVYKEASTDHDDDENDEDEYQEVTDTDAFEALVPE